MKVKSHENRGTPDVPFGFVYFDDNVRVYYAKLLDGLTVEGFEGPYWVPFTAEHVKLARLYLEELGDKVGRAF